MTRTLLRWMALCLAGLLALSGGNAMAEITDPRWLQPSPWHQWYTLESAHALIHFREGHEDYARRMAAIADATHPPLSARMGWEPAQKIHIVVNDNVDVSNGGATIYPYNRFFAYMNETTAGELKDHSDFAETLLTHEYTHLLHLDQNAGIPGTIRQVFGKAPPSVFSLLAMPQIFGPHWLSEGVAIYEESANGFGRNNSALFAAMMREEVRTGLADFTEESFEGYYNSRWPFGQVYLYGAFFFQFLAERYGEAAIRTYIADYNRNLLPWRMHKRARRATGKDAVALWDEYRDYLRTRFSSEIAAREAAGLTPAKTLYVQPWSNRLLTPGPNGSVFFYHVDRRHKPRIMQLFADGRRETVYQVGGVSALSWHPNAGLLIAKPDACDNRALYTDVYRLDVIQKKLQRLTHCARLPRATWGPDAESVIAVQTGGGKNTLVRVTLDGEVESLSQMALGEAIGQPHVTADGRVMVAVKRNGQGWGLAAYSLLQQRWQTVLHDRSLVSRPHTHPGHDGLYFVSDHGGEVELRRRGADGVIETLTRSQGYVREGVVASDGAIWLSEYTGDGEIVRRIAPEDVRSLAEAPVAQDTRELLPIALSDADLSRPIKPYSPWASLAPAGWAPVFLTDGDNTSVGVQLTGADVLGFHRWSLQPLLQRDEREGDVGGTISYSFDGRLTLFASRDATTVGDYDVPESMPYREIQDNAQALVRFPINRVGGAAEVFAGVAWQKTALSPVPEDAVAEARDHLVGVGVTYNTFSRYPHAITRGNGIGVRLMAETFDAFATRSTHRGEAAVASVTGHWRFGQNQTLVGQVVGGAGEARGKPFVLGDTSDGSNTLGGITPLGKRRYALPGYSPRDALRGKSFVRGSLAWHFPVASLYDGFSVPPVGLGRINGNLFTQTGAAWTTRDERDFYPTVGAQLRVEVLIGYDNLLLPITLGVARGLNERIGEDVFYVGLDIPL